MTKEEHAKVLEQTQILRDIAYHLTENGYSMTGRDIKLAALEIEAAIMRKEPEPISDARNFPHNTCPASRHAEIIGKALVNGKPYPMLTEEPEHCGESILSVVQSLYAARTKLALLEKAE